MESSSSTTTTTAEDLLPALKGALGPQVAQNAKDYNLLQYLRWKLDVPRAAERYKGFLAWRKENRFAMDDSSKALRVSQDAKLQHVLASQVLVAPVGMRAGNCPVVVGRLRHNDMRDGRTVQDVVRMALYTVDRLLADNLDAQCHGIVLFHDLRGLSRDNIDVRIPKMLLSALIGHFPIRIRGIYIYQAPFFFRRVLFPVISMLMPAKLKARVHFVEDLETEIYDKVIPRSEMLTEHGGERVFDVQAWIQEQIERERQGTIQSLADCPISA